MDFKARMELMERRVLLVLQALLVDLVQWDHLDRREPLAQLDHRDKKEMQVLRGHLDQLVPQELLVCLDLLVKLANKEMQEL